MSGPLPDPSAQRSREYEELRQSQQRLALHFQQTTLGAIEWDLEFRVSRWNVGAERIFGYSAEEALGRHASFIVPPDAREHVDLVWQDLQARKGGDQSTNENLTKDARRILCQWHNTPLVAADGQVIGAASLVEDISERKRAEQELHLARGALEKLVATRTAELNIFHRFAEASGEGFGMSTLDGHIVYVNPTLYRLFGEQEPEDVIGRSVSEYYPPEYMLRRRSIILPHLLKHGHWHGEQTLLPRHGPPRETLQSTFLIHDENGQPIRVAVVISDITEKKRADLALRQNHDEMHAIYDGMPDGMLVAEIESKRFIRCNAAMRRMLGYSQEEILVRCVKDIHPPDDLPHVLEIFEAMVHGEMFLGVEIPVLRKDGSVFHADVTHVEILVNGRACSVGFFRDVTERRRAEEALRREHRTLKHLLQSSDHERQLIAYEIHDGLAQQLAGAIMQFQTFEALKESRPKQAADAYSAGVTMLQQGHFETRRLIAGVRPPILDESGVVEAIAHLVNELRRSKGPKIEFRNSVEFDRLVPVLENAIYRIAQEGLTNACQHSQSDRVRINLDQRAERVRIEIQDWGIGFDVKVVHKNHYGLDGIRQRARLLDGKCNIRSCPGKGTKISVELPVVLRHADE
ncbi:MAG: PAS domain S-box protein [Chthoniobacteraceae bacterium]